jgi:hypothetical protein
MRFNNIENIVLISSLSLLICCHIIKIVYMTSYLIEQVRHRLEACKNN